MLIRDHRISARRAALSHLFSGRAVLVIVFLLGTPFLGSRARAQDFEVLHTFTAEAGYPNSLLLATDGRLYGTAASGGGFGKGSVFVLTPNGDDFDFSTLWEFSGPDGESPNGLVQGSDGNFYGTTAAGGSTERTIWGSIGYGTVFRIDASGSLTTLRRFSRIDGAAPQGELVQGSDGGFYGTTSLGGTAGGPAGAGTLFRIEAAGSFITLFNFNGTAISLPGGKLVQGTDGKFYGVAGGGTYGRGVVFRVDASGSFTVLHNFTYSDGAAPAAGLLMANDGKFYGTTIYGGSGEGGTVFRIDAGGSLETLHNFGQYTGNPSMPLVEASDGAIYGSTGRGGPTCCGTLFRIDTSGSFTTIHAFGGFDGGVPFSPLVIGSDGSLLGTTVSDGYQYGTGYGTIFRLQPDGTLRTIYRFDKNKGASPCAGLVQASDGLLYGTTYRGGEGGLGAIFRIDSSGSLTTLHSFVKTDGEAPAAGLVQGTDGDFYGTTLYGGLGEAGTVFRIDSTGSLTTLQSFMDNGAEALYPSAGLIQGSDEGFYGTTTYGFDFGTNGPGAIFRVDPTGSFTILHVFDYYEEGSHPVAGLVEGSDGAFYGTTPEGPYGSLGGTVFRIDTSGTMTMLYTFGGEDGAFPRTELTAGADGYLYGTTTGWIEGWGHVSYGTIFRIDALGSLTTLHTFTGSDGAYPLAALLQASDGAFYGTTSEGGADNYGTIYRLDTAGSLTILHSFSGGDGKYPLGRLVQGTDGSFYGTTREGGPYDAGLVFRLTVPLVCSPPVEVTGPDALCSGQTATLSASPAFSSYRWSTGETSPSISAEPSQTTVYSVDAVGQYSCTSSASKTVTVHPTPAVPAINRSANPDGSVRLTSSPAPSYLWSTGATTQWIDVSTSGDYSVTVSNGFGCSAISEVTSVSVTPTGSGVSVTAGDVTTTFSSVSNGGTTTVTPIDPGTAGSLPSGGYAVSDLGVAYEISTTAAASGDITLAFVVPENVDLVTFNSLRILHGEGGVLVDRTYFSPEGCSPANPPCPAPDFATRTIYARVSSLSPFVLATIGTPAIDPITVPTNPVSVSTQVNVQATFTDPDTHTAVWSWDDGTSSPGVVIEAGGLGTVTGTHTYSAAGVYRATLTVTDIGGATAQRISGYIVVYDPNGGFVTGGGWITSPPGAYAANAALTGKATFGFVSKYAKNATAPSGETEFQFGVANFRFASDAYEWLVISGAKARYRGVGKVNGAGSYGFELTAWDGQVGGGGGIDKIRIKIWDRNQGNGVVYDNQMNAVDGADPTTALGGGSIVIHK